ncbi:hypothetical protein [Bordetella sp. LUAb4]|uniref:hypothetical protein n=1 Tax=Bordetella sp. LUAb4 TaxID=2843195 RepID=UPI001E40103D|nr:hypothetical protein [Bordetella sp. LUAb4]
MSSLKCFIEDQQSRAKTQASFDWGRRRDKWLRELDEVFGWIQGQLSAAGLSQQAVTRSCVDLNEDRLGHYQAPALSVQLPTRVFIDFRPKASVIIGGYGRIDVESRHALKRVLLIAVDADDERDPDDQTPSYEREWAWRVFSAGGMHGSYPLDVDGLGRLFEDVVA